MFETMSFSDALNHLKSGGKVYRDGWNGKGMYLYLESDLMRNAEYHKFEPCIVMFTAQGKHQPGWLASQADLLAEDWLLVD